MIRDGRIKLKIGADRSILRTVVNIPAGLTMTKAWLTVKNNLTDTDLQAVFQLIITPSANTTGQITDTGGSGTGTIVFNILAAQSSLLVEGQKYVYDIQVHYGSSNTNDPIEEGTIYASGRITQATS